jgi:putative ABC transport system permease protein
MNWVIRALVRLYPRSFREEFAASILALADKELDAASRRGWLALMFTFALQCADIVRSASAEQVRGIVRATKFLASMHGWRRDAIYGTRMLAKHRVFSAVVIVTLALAIGANTVIFTFANILLLKPLPVRDPDHLGWVYGVGPQADGDRAKISMADYLDYRTAKSFSSLAARRFSTLTLSEGGDARRLNTALVTSNLFEVWGIPLELGRGLRAGEDAPGAGPVAVLSDQFWRRHFAGDRTVLGRAMELDGIAYTVVGVVGPAMEIGNVAQVDVWAPLTIDPSASARDDRILSATGRLAPGVSIGQANAEIRAIASRLEKEHPTTNGGWGARVATTHESITGRGAWTALALLGLVVAFVLMIACANLANLMLARANERTREVALRAALGAGRGEVVRQLVVESLILGLVGGAAGLALAYAGLVAIKAASYNDLFAGLTIDGRVLAFVALITLATSLAFSIMPAIRASRANIADLLRNGSAKATGGQTIRRGRSLLVVSQVALALSLSIMAGLTVRSLVITARITLGFDTHDLFAFTVDLPVARVPESDLRAFYGKALDELRRIPGVTDVGVGDRLPVIGGERPGPVTIEGRDVVRPSDRPWATSSSVSPGFIEAARIHVSNGRTFLSMDNAAGARVAIVNEEMARRYWGSSAAALGKHVARGGAEPHEWLSVVGVVANTAPSDVTLPPGPQLYVPIDQVPTRTVSFLVRGGTTAGMSSAIRAAMRRIDPTLAIYDANTMDQAFKIYNASDVIVVSMYLAFVAIALALAAAGVYGVISYSVSQRTREFGIRMALGASTSQVRRMVLSEGGRLLAVGAVLGLAGGALIGVAARSLLYGVSPLDPSSYLLTVALLTGVMGLATYIPARRATNVDPNDALRAD